MKLLCAMFGSQSPGACLCEALVLHVRVFDCLLHFSLELVRSNTCLSTRPGQRTGQDSGARAGRSGQVNIQAVECRCTPASACRQPGPCQPGKGRCRFRLRPGPAAKVQVQVQLTHPRLDGSMLTK